MSKNQKSATTVATDNTQPTVETTQPETFNPSKRQLAGLVVIGMINEAKGLTLNEMLPGVTFGENVEMAFNEILADRIEGLSRGLYPTNLDDAEAILNFLNEKWPNEVGQGVGKGRRPEGLDSFYEEFGQIVKGTASDAVQEKLDQLIAFKAKYEGKFTGTSFNNHIARTTNAIERVTKYMAKEKANAEKAAEAEKATSDKAVKAAALKAQVANVTPASTDKPAAPVAKPVVAVAKPKVQKAEKAEAVA